MRHCYDVKKIYFKNQNLKFWKRKIWNTKISSIFSKFINHSNIITNGWGMFFDIRRISFYTKELIRIRTHPYNQYWKFQFSSKIRFFRLWNITFGMSYLEELIPESYFNIFFRLWRTFKIFTTIQSDQNSMIYTT